MLLPSHVHPAVSERGVGGDIGAEPPLPLPPPIYSPQMKMNYAFSSVTLAHKHQEHIQLLPLLAQANMKHILVEITLFKTINSTPSLVKHEADKVLVVLYMIWLNCLLIGCILHAFGRVI